MTMMKESEEWLKDEESEDRSPEDFVLAVPELV